MSKCIALPNLIPKGGCMKIIHYSFTEFLSWPETEPMSWSYMTSTLATQTTEKLQRTVFFSHKQTLTHASTKFYSTFIKLPETTDTKLAQTLLYTQMYEALIIY